MNGVKSGKTNQVEAEAIADAVAQLVADPQHRQRSIGMVSLVGSKQAELAQRLILDRIGQEAYLHHKVSGCWIGCQNRASGWSSDGVS